MELKNICLFKLVSGEVLVSEYKLVKSNYALIRPMSIQTLDVYNKNMEIRGTQVSVKPWIDHSPSDFFMLSKKLVLVKCQPYPEILKTYEEIRNQEDILDAGDDLEEIADQYFNSLAGATSSNKKIDPDEEYDIFDDLEDGPPNPRITF